MNRYLRSVLAAACLQLSASVLLAEEPVVAAPAGNQGATAAGESCIGLRQIKSTKVLDDRTILFELHGNETLVNHLPRRCPGLGFEKSFGYKTSISQLCSQDIIWVVTHIGSGLDRGASCGLGKFEPYVAPETDAAAKGKLEPM